MIDVEVIDTPDAAIVALVPIRSRILAELAGPASAATLASRLGCQAIVRGDVVVEIQE